MDREDKDLLLHMAAIREYCKQRKTCFGCRMEMEPGHSACFFQLGQRPSDWKDAVIAMPVEEVNPRFRNWYRCDHCKTVWDDVWDCTCDDRCPMCDTSISPYTSEEIKEK